VHNTVQGQLAEQQITFPPSSTFAHAKAGTEITPSMIPSVSQYAGQQLLTGQQAEAYADHFIAVHIADMSGGKTYSQLSAQAQAQPRAPRCRGVRAAGHRADQRGRARGGNRLLTTEAPTSATRALPRARGQIAGALGVRF
jgi:hypothetical protein